jgi:two-component system NarL family response regulator
MMRVLLADDHRLVVEGIENLLSVHGIEVVGVANDGLEAVAMDLILMDIRMPRCDGLAATRMIKTAQPEIQIVMLTTSTEDQDLFEAVRSGACGYLLKSMSGDAFIEALRGVEEGVPPFSPGLASRLMKEFARLSQPAEPTAPPDVLKPDDRKAIQRLEAEGLTERQAEVLALVASGLTYQEAGDQLSLSERTIRFHMTQIINKLHLYNRAQLLAYAGKLGIVPPP